MRRRDAWQPQDGSNEHYALLFTPEVQRPAAAAILGFAHAMRDLTAVQADVAPIKVRWWHEELVRFEQGEPRHPLCQALTGASGPALCEALNALLHGAVMDINEVQIGDDTLDEYLRMRSGALHAALAVAAGVDTPGAALRDAATLCGLADLLREARDPGHAQRPAAHIAVDGIAPSDTQAVEQALGARVAAAAAALPAGAGPTVTGAVLIDLYKAWWPRIMATPYGQATAPLGPWRQLYCAWRAARAQRARGPAT